MRSPQLAIEQRFTVPRAIERPRTEDPRLAWAPVKGRGRLCDPSRSNGMHLTCICAAPDFTAASLAETGPVPATYGGGSAAADAASSMSTAAMLLLLTPLIDVTLRWRSADVATERWSEYRTAYGGKTKL